MDMLDTLKDLRRIINEDFYRRLLEGKIDDAKNTGNYIISLISEINETINTAEPNTSKELSETRKELQEKGIEFKNLVESELKGIDKKTFQEDPAVWKELLIESFGGITNQLLATVNRLIEQIKKPSTIKNAKKGLLPPIYSPQYIKLKKNFRKDQIKRINKAEEKIIYYLSKKIFTKKITDKILTGP